MSQITIRHAKPTDFEAIQRLNHEHFLYEVPLDYGTRNTNWPYTDEAIKYFKQSAAGQNGCQAFMAEADGRPVGYLIGLVADKLYMAQSPVGELKIMFLEAEYRRQGAGSLLVNEFKAWARAQGATYLKVGALAANHLAVEFYRKHGFRDMEVSLEQPLND